MPPKITYGCLFLGGRAFCIFEKLIPGGLETGTARVRQHEKQERYHQGNSDKAPEKSAGERRRRIAFDYDGFRFGRHILNPFNGLLSYWSGRDHRGRFALGYRLQIRESLGNRIPLFFADSCDHSALTGSAGHVESNDLRGSEGASRIAPRSVHKVKR